MAYYPSLLYLKEFRCVEETDELGNDSPYFVVFVGNKAGQPSSDVVRVRDPAWDGAAHSGKLFQPNMWVHNQVDTNSVVLVALLEEDYAPDINAGKIEVLKLLMQAKWAIYGGWNLSNSQLAYLARSDLANYLQGLLANDEYIQTKHLTISTSVGNLPLLTFGGDGGFYRVRFHMVSTQG